MLQANLQLFFKSWFRKKHSFIQIIVNPFEYGDPFEKKTCLWTKGVPNLVPTAIVDVPPRTQFKSGKTMASWYCDALKLPKAERAKLRSKTFPGIAKAMAEQWGGLI